MNIDGYIIQDEHIRIIDGLEGEGGPIQIQAHITEALGVAVNTARHAAIEKIMNLATAEEAIAWQIKYRGETKSRTITSKSFKIQ